MLTRYGPSDVVKQGTYLSLKSGDFVTIGEPLGRLPQGNGKYIAISPLVALLVGPLAGLLFIIFLPFAVPAVILWILLGRARTAVPTLIERWAATAEESSSLVARGIAGEVPWLDGKPLDDTSGNKDR